MSPEHDDLQFRFSMDEAGTFEGYAVVYAEQNKHRELYQPGAFKRSLDEHRQIGSKPAMLWSHDQREVIGVWTDVREDRTGLFVRGQLLLDTVKGREVATMIRAGAVNGLSIGFRKIRDKLANGVRTLLDVDLAEISVVAVPSAGRARIANYRNANGRSTSAAAFVEACRKATRSLEKQP